MPAIDQLLKRLRHAPEPLKRQLRPALVRVVSTVRAVPGGRPALRVLRRIAPGLHGWVLRRYLYYTDNAIGAPAVSQAAEAATLDSDALIVLGCLRGAGTGRVN